MCHCLDVSVEALVTNVHLRKREMEEDELSNGSSENAFYLQVSNPRLGSHCLIQCTGTADACRQFYHQVLFSIFSSFISFSIFLSFSMPFVSILYFVLFSSSSFAQHSLSLFALSLQSMRAVKYLSVYKNLSTK